MKLCRKLKRCSLTEIERWLLIRILKIMMMKTIIP